MTADLSKRPCDNALPWFLHPHEPTNQPSNWWCRMADAECKSPATCNMRVKAEGRFRCLTRSG